MTRRIRAATIRTGRPEDTRDREIAQAGHGTGPTGSTGLRRRRRTSPTRAVSARTATVPATRHSSPAVLLVRPDSIRLAAHFRNGSRAATPGSAGARRVRGIRPAARRGRLAPRGMAAAPPADTSLSPALARRRDSPHRRGRLSNQGRLSSQGPFRRGVSASSPAPFRSRGTARTGSDRPPGIRPAAPRPKEGTGRLSNPASDRPATRRTAAMTRGTGTRQTQETASRPGENSDRHRVRDLRTASHPRTGFLRRTGSDRRARARADRSRARASPEGSRSRPADFPAGSRPRTSSRRLDRRPRPLTPLSSYRSSPELHQGRGQHSSREDLRAREDLSSPAGPRSPAGSSSRERSSSREGHRLPRSRDRALTSASTSASGRAGRAHLEARADPAAPAPLCAAASPTRGPDSDR